MTEPELIDAARRGDAAAWEQLVSAHQEAVFRLAYLLLGDPDEAQDVAQEALIRAYYALPRFDSSHPLRPWLLRIVSNLAKNRRRSLARFLAALARFANEPRERPLVAAPVDDSASLLWQAIRRLGRPHQQALYLRYFMEMPEAEIAQTLAIAPGTVKSRLHRAQQALRELIDREYPDLQPETRSAMNTGGEA